MMTKTPSKEGRDVHSFVCRALAGLFCAVLSAGLMPGASAALLVYEPFDYPANERVLGKTNPSTGNVWELAAGSGAGGDTTSINTASGNLTPPPQLGAAVGNSATITGVGSLSGATNRLALPAGTGSNPPPDTATESLHYYYSLLLRIDDVSNSNTGVGGFVIGFNNATGAQNTNPSSVAARLQIRQDPNDTTKYNLGIVRQRGANAGNIPWSGPMTPGETLFLVASTELVPGGESGAGNDISRLWINPDPSTFGGAMPPAATITDDAALSSTDIGVFSLILRQSPAPFLTLDEIRVGTTWAAVTVPEPGVFALIGLAAAMLTSRRFRRAW